MDTLDPWIVQLSMIIFNENTELPFDIGGSLSLGTDQSISQEEILYLEKEINILNGSLPELENFILPGGSPASSLAQYARSVCRRCERSL